MREKMKVIHNNGNVEQFAVILNGPPRSGKDYVSEKISNESPQFTHVKFSSPLKAVVSDAMGMDQDKLEGIKDDDITLHNGRVTTYRDEQIALFNYLSDHYGDEVLGRMLIQFIKDRKSTLELNGFPFVIISLIMSDGGRGPEMELVANHVGHDRTLIIQLEREGTSFDGDIRGYVSLGGVKTIRVKNDGTDRFVLRVAREIVEWIEDSVVFKELTKDASEIEVELSR